MERRVVRGGSRIPKAVSKGVSLDQWWSDWSQDTGRPAWSNRRDHLRLVKSSQRPLDAINALADLEAENRALRNRVVDLALSIQILQAQQTAD